MKNFIYVNDANHFIDMASFVVHLNEIDNEDNLFDKLYTLLELPYFGFNYNALYDCLRDFYWVKQYKIIIVHDDLPQVECYLLNAYVDVLYDAINDWKEGEEHELDVVFPKQYEQKIESLITRKNL